MAWKEGSLLRTGLTKFAKEGVQPSKLAVNEHPVREVYEKKERRGVRNKHADKVRCLDYSWEEILTKEGLVLS